jgi:dTDP-glucose pyrophosphorylase/CBS domain-containing protein
VISPDQSLPLVDPQASIRVALSELDRRGLEIVLIADVERRVLGVMTDGDFRRALLAGRTLEDAAADVMNRRFVSVGPEVSRAEVLDLMRARGLQQIPVIDARGRLAGLHVLRELIGAVLRPNWAVIMAGGRGERLRPLTDDVPKPMLCVAGRPILERLVLHLVGYGIRRVYLAVNYKAEEIERHFGDGDGHGCEIIYLREDHPLGTAGALTLLPEPPSTPLLVMNGDLVTNVDVGGLLTAHAAGGNVVTVAVHEHAYRVPFGVVEEGPAGVVDGLREKPTERWTVNAGMYVVDSAALAAIPAGEPYTMPALMEDCLNRGERVGLYRIEDDWIDVGRPRELMKARGEG